MKAQLRVRNTSAAAKPGPYAVSARTSRSAIAATHKTLLFRECGEQLTPQTRPRPPDHGRTDATSLHSALVVVLIKEKSLNHCHI